MTKEKLLKIKTEIERFERSIDDAIGRFDSDTYGTAYQDRPWGIAGTAESGAVKRKFIDLKYEVTKILKNN